MSSKRLQVAVDWHFSTIERKRADHIPVNFTSGISLCIVLSKFTPTSLCCFMYKLLCMTPHFHSFQFVSRCRHCCFDKLISMHLHPRILDSRYTKAAFGNQSLYTQRTDSPAAGFRIYKKERKTETLRPIILPSAEYNKDDMPDPRLPSNKAFK